MSIFWVLTITGVLAYVLGSIPNGYLAGKFAGIDIRNVGSGNIGATNVLRQLGKRWGYAVFVADAAKGIFAVLLGLQLSKSRGMPQPDSLGGVTAAVFCILGHSFPVWLGFRGGKGVATAAGAIAILMPMTLFVMIVVWITLFQLTRFVSLASIAAAGSLPVTTLILLHFGLLHSWSLLWFSISISVIVIWSHRGNIKRLLSGTELRFKK